MAKKLKIGIVLVNYNTASMTQDQLADLEKIDTSNLIVNCYVVDCNSSDDSKNILTNHVIKNMDYKYIQLSKNLGYAGGNNVGIKKAVSDGSDYVLVINNDLMVEKNLLKKLVDFMEKNESVGITSPKIYFAKGYEFHKDRYKSNELGKVIWYAGALIDYNNVYVNHVGVDQVDIGQYDEFKKTEVASGACMIVRKNVFEKVGYFDEDLFLYWEDADFSERVRMCGFNIYYYPFTHVWHKISSSVGGSGGKLNDYYLTRNRYYFSMRYSKFRTKFAVFRESIKLVLFGRKWVKIGALHGLLGIKGVGL